MDRAQKRLAFVWFGLLGLLGLTVAGSFTFTGAASAVVSIGIAVAKAALIFWFFMQLRREKGLTRIVAVGAVAWLTILLIFVSLDLATR